MTNVVVDIGNSKIKTAVFNVDALVSRYTASSLEEVKAHYADRQHAWIFSSVAKPEEEIRQVFQGEEVLVLSRNTPLPVEVNYDTPETLGLDRIAAAAGAQYFYPDQDVLVIDLGTCITYDIIDRAGIFQGGVIAPGLKMRMRAMSHFTHRLPDISQEWRDIVLQDIGKSTRQCMVNGTYTALIHEMNGFIEVFTKEYGNLTVMMTGGDAVYFESNLKAPIFANFDLVLIGLNRILKYNQ